MSLYEVKGVGLLAVALCASCGGEATRHGGAGVFQGTQGAFISSSPATGTDARWSVHADGATTVLTYTSTPSPVRVRCVRVQAAADAPEPRYTYDKLGDTETVTDLGTGLLCSLARLIVFNYHAHLYDVLAALSLNWHS